MKKKSYVFAVGDRVGLAISSYDDEYGDGDTSKGKLRFNQDEDPEYGVVTDTLSNGNVHVKWDNEWYEKYHTGEQDVSELLPEATLKKEYARLEDEFNNLEKEVKLKLKEAAKLVKDAHKIAKKTGHDLVDMYEAVRPLVNAMDSSGWRSSSWGC